MTCESIKVALKIWWIDAGQSVVAREVFIIRVLEDEGALLG